MRVWVIGLCMVSTLACASDPNEDAIMAGQAGTQAGVAAAGAIGAGAGGIAGTAGQAGAIGGMSGGAMAGSGGVGASGGSIADASVDAMTSADAAQPDAGSAAVPLAQRVCPAGPFGDPLPPEGQRTASLVGDGFGFIEGPVWLAAQGVLLFSDMDFGAPASSVGPPSRIRRLMPPSTFDVFQESANSNGLALDVDGELLACTHDLQTLSRFDVVTAQRMPLSSLTYDGLHFNSPNDLTVRSDGTIYFTDPDWQLGTRSSETQKTSVYRVTPAGTVELVTSMLDKPNGIALAPDEHTLYIGSSGSEIWKHAVNEDGSVQAGEVFASAGGGTDGFAIDCAGNLYAAGGSNVQVWNATGDKLGDIAVPEGPSNAAFGGADRKTLYITAQSGLYAIELRVPGLPY